MSSDKPAPSTADIQARANGILASHNAITVASTNDQHSPWVLGAFFAHDGFALYLLLEASGRTMKNLRANPTVAFMISDNDASKDFLQGSGTAQLLSAEYETAVRERLVGKMPWFQTYTPCIPVRIDASEILVSSLASGWFPAKRIVAS